MKNSWSIWLQRLFVLTAVALILCLPSQTSARDSWTVYLYMCGSDLESNYGYATKNLDALKSVKLPENVKFLIETGGAEKWHSKDIPSDALGLYVYDNTGFHELEQLPDANMSEAQTLQDFLRYGEEHFPADKRMLVLWDHGGGSLGGICADERFDTSISLYNLRRALAGAIALNPNEPPFDLVMFDACLMGSLETANALYGFTKYMVASEEIMPGTGTDYAGWAGALAANPSMDGKELGKIICETYLPYCEENEVDRSATLSLIDLEKLPKLNAAYEEMGREALREAGRNPVHFFTALDRVADGVEHYGPKSEESGINMIDLGSLAENVEGLKTAENFSQVLNEAVLYRVAGIYRQHGRGLSGYYSLDANLSTWQIYASLPNVSPAFSELYKTMIVGNGSGTPWFNFDIKRIEHAPVVLDENNIAVVTLLPEDANAISNVSFRLCFYDEKDRLVYLGDDDKLEVDWDKGIFKDNFDGQWPALNGHFIPMELEEQQREYNLYYSYILLNGKKCYLKVIYDMEKQAFEILGAQRILKGGWLDREILQLQAGDKITPLFMDADDKEVKGDSFILETAPVIEDIPLPEGTYAFAFRFAMPHNAATVSETIHFVIQDGQLTAVK